MGQFRAGGNPKAAGTPAAFGASGRADSYKASFQAGIDFMYARAFSLAGA